MFSVTVMIGSASWRLLYQKEENAVRDFNSLEQMRQDKTQHFNGHPQLLLTDDYGQKALVIRESLHGAMFEDMEKTKQATIEFMLHNARIETKARQTAETDPVLRAGRPQHGPAIIQPMPMMHNGRG